MNLVDDLEWQEMAGKFKVEEKRIETEGDEQVNLHPVGMTGSRLNH